MRRDRPRSQGFVFQVLGTVVSALLWPFLFLLCLVARFVPKSIDVGLGPHPLINNIYHKRALAKFGYTGETFVHNTYFITDAFDINPRRARVLRLLPGQMAGAVAALIVFAASVWRYRAVYIHFNGSALASLPGFLGRCEPFFYRLAGVKVVVMPYGGDVQDMTRSPNLYFKHTLSQDYPVHRFRRARISRYIDMWTNTADHVISGVEWVDYMFHWDTLMLGHFSIDTDELRPGSIEPSGAGPNFDGADQQLRLLHAPNHRDIKGTDAVVKAVKNLRARGYNIHLELIEKRSNAEVLSEIARADLVIDQLVVGWYAMFALESMALGKPVVCYTRSDLVDLYRKAGLLEKDEIPFLNADTLSFESLLENVVTGGHDLNAVGEKGRAYVEKYHSLEAVGATFDRINRSIGIVPRAVRS